MRSTYAFATQNPRKRPVMGWLPLPVMGLVLVPVTGGHAGKGVATAAVTAATTGSAARWAWRCAQVAAWRRWHLLPGQAR
jgi:hypothetical protein